MHGAQTYRPTFAVFAFDQLRVFGGHNGGVIAMMETNTYLYRWPTEEFSARVQVVLQVDMFHDSF